MVSAAAPVATPFPSRNQLALGALLLAESPAGRGLSFTMIGGGATGLGRGTRSQAPAAASGIAIIANQGRRRGVTLISPDSEASTRSESASRAFGSLDISRETSAARLGDTVAGSGVGASDKMREHTT